MEELKKLVRELEGKTGKEEIVKILREIGEKLVTEYEIIVDGITVIPLWVEAYYYQGSNKKADERNTYKSRTGFIDPFVHGSKEQRGEENFGKLYFHHKTDDQRSGVDICLPLSDQYYLSFLLKYTLVNGEFTTQSELSGKIREKYDPQSRILFSVEHSDKPAVIYSKRKGVSAKKEKDTAIKAAKEKYEDMKVACILLDRINDFEFTFETGYGKTRLLEDYIANNQNIDKEKISKLCEGLISKVKLKKLLSK